MYSRDLFCWISLGVAILANKKCPIYKKKHQEILITFKHVKYVKHVKYGGQGDKEAE